MCETVGLEKKGGEKIQKKKQIENDRHLSSCYELIVIRKSHHYHKEPPAALKCHPEYQLSYFL